MPHTTPLTESAIATMEGGLQRNEVFDIIPEGSTRILDIGYGSGCLLLRLMKQKGCSECYGMELSPSENISPYLEENWNIDLMEEELPEKYEGFFNWVVLHDVLEHVYNPWKFLGIVNKYVAQGGRVAIVCPNAQDWEGPYSLLTGNWPLGKHGFWNESHIRWFTFKTLSEVAIMAGLGIESAFLQYPERIHAHMNEFNEFQKKQHEPHLDLPPVGFPAGHIEDGLPFVSPTDANEPLKILLSRPSSEVFPYIMAIKIMLICEKRGEPEVFDLKYNHMPQTRQEFYQKLGKKELEARTPNNIQVQAIRD